MSSSTSLASNKIPLPVVSPPVMRGRLAGPVHTPDYSYDRSGRSQLDPKVHAAGGAVEFQYISDRAGFERLEKDWNDLFARTAEGRHVFQSYNWLWHWLNHYGGHDQAPAELAVVAGYINDTLALVWPMAVKRSLGLNRLIFMGAPVSQYGDALIDPDLVRHDDLLAAWRFLTKNAKADVAHLRKVRADAAIAPVVSNLALRPIETNTAPCLDLASASSFDGYQNRYSSKSRKNRRRLRRRLAEQGDVSVTLQHDRHQRAALVERAIHLKRAWLHARGHISPTVQDDRMVAFFQSASKSDSHPTGCRMASIRVGDKMAAVEISFRAHNHLAVHLIVYDLAFEKCGAGALLMEDSIKDALESGVATFDLMAPGDDYKMDWADKAIDVDDWMVGLNNKGRLYLRLQLSKATVRGKSALQTMPVALRRYLAKGLSLAL